MCAGQGHDVVGALDGHPRGGDVRATLIEVDDHNVRAARERVAAAGLPKVEVIEGDASTTDIYQGHVPAEIVLVCGLFGNLSDADIRRAIRHLPMLCTERACRGAPARLERLERALLGSSRRTTRLARDRAGSTWSRRQ